MVKKNPRRAILYARVSMDEQGEGPSLDEQLADCRKYAAEKGLVRVAEVKEDYTGTVLDRPELTRVLKMFQDGTANALVALKFDRLSRNYIDFLILRDSFERSDIELHLVQYGKSQPGFNGLLIESVYALMAQGERDNIIERSKMGKDGRARRGTEISTAVLPFGYARGNKNEIVIVEDEAQVVRLIYKWYLYGIDGRGACSLAELTKELNRRKIPTSSHFPAKRSEGWNKSFVFRILNSETYAGTMYWGQTRIVKDKRERQPPDKWIKVDVPAIIDRQTFAACQKRMKHNREDAIRNRKRNYLLVGHVICGHCGWAMAGHTIGNWMYYQCVNNGRSQGMVGSIAHIRRNGGCVVGNRHVSVRLVDDPVQDKILYLLNNEQELMKALDQMENQVNEHIQPRRDRLEYVYKAIDQEEKRVDRLVNHLGGIDDPIVSAAVKKEIRDSSDRRNILLEEKMDLEIELRDIKFDRDTKKNVLSIARNIREKFRMMTFENFRWILDVLDVKVVVTMDSSKTAKKRSEDVDVDIVIGFPVDKVSIASLPLRQIGRNINNRVFVHIHI